MCNMHITAIMQYEMCKGHKSFRSKPNGTQPMRRVLQRQAVRQASGPDQGVLAGQSPVQLIGHVLQQLIHLSAQAAASLVEELF